MLCDEIILDTELIETYDGLDKLYRKIFNAQKFVLSKEFTYAADGLVDNYPELQKVLPWCRIPYPLTWIEWVHDDRPHWDPKGPYKETTRPVDPSRHQHAPHRCGLLLEQRKDRASAWKAHLVWSMKEKPAVGSRFNASLGAHDVDIEDTTRNEDPLISAVQPGMADFGHQLIVDLSEEAPQVAMRLLEYTLDDWGGEIRFMIAVLGLMNTKNVMHVQNVDNTEYNRKRIKAKQKPLFSHKLLKIQPVIWRRMKDTNTPTGQHGGMRQHFVTGHFKERKTGVFWWNSYMRGNPERGVVEKEYEVTK